MSDKLTIKQEKFCQSYIETGNASEAYRRAYDAGKMKDEAIHVNASKLLASTKVSLRVKQLQDEAAKRNEITVDKVVRELALIGFSNMLDYIKTQDDGSFFVDMSKLTREQATAIGEVTCETYFEGKGEDAVPVKRTKFKLSDKRAALVDLGKHLGMFEKDNAQKGEAAAKAMAEAAQTSSRDLARAVLGVLREAQVEQPK
jgi:phage terminase small subunit